MPKRTRENRSENALPEIGEPSPPQLSEKLIAQLQGAVSAALQSASLNPVMQPRNK